MTKHVIIQGDCMDVLKKLEDNSIHLVVTSPPYNVGIEYDNDIIDTLDWGLYFEKMQIIIKELHRVLVDGGRVCWNVQIDVRRKEEDRINLMQRFKNIFDKYFIDMGDIIWIEETMTKRTAWGSWCSPSSPYIQMPLECILVYAKNSKKLDGEKTDLTPKEFMDWVSGIWRFNNNTLKESHPASFPKELPKRCIKLFSFVGQTILDPFAGSGTTLMVARDLNRNSIGIELSENYCRRIKEKLGYGQQQINNHIEYEILTAVENTQNPTDFGLLSQTRLIAIKRETVVSQNPATQDFS